ncbi:branched-chain amino acid transport system permease protein [Nakamurella sp. UYEF19]|uniref:branched-chain amino acid ABC transporter permease n=1 Tax=Nakamurella sp. UYEF19 TaxID=1756392 RepID=UPI00339AF89B
MTTQSADREPRAASEPSDAQPITPAGTTSPVRKHRRRLPFVIRRNSRSHVGLIGVGVVVGLAMVLWGGGFGQFNQGQLTRVMIYAIAIAGLNIATGYTGLVSVGHSAFFGLGAYTTGILVVRHGWSPEATIPVAFVVCFVVGLVVGLPALRIRGLYLAMVTLAFGVAFPEVIARFSDLTGGAQGLTIRRAMLRPPSWSGFSLSEKGQWLYWLCVVVLILVLIVVHNVVRSRYGLAMMAARDNEIAASASGVNLAVVKTSAFGLSGALTGVGGSLFAMYLGSLVANDSFTLLNAIALLTGLVIGGEATRFGPIIGAIAVVYIPYYTSDLGQGQAAAVLFGAALIIIVFIAPEGLTGAFFRVFRRVLTVIPVLRKPQPPAD